MRSSQAPVKPADDCGYPGQWLRPGHAINTVYASFQFNGHHLSTLAERNDDLAEALCAKQILKTRGEEDPHLGGHRSAANAAIDISRRVSAISEALETIVVLFEQG